MSVDEHTRIQNENGIFIRVLLNGEDVTDLCVAAVSNDDGWVEKYPQRPIMVGQKQEKVYGHVEFVRERVK